MALTASYLSGSSPTASYSISASLAQTASYAINSVSASYYGGTVTTASYSVSASYSQTASYYGGSITSASYAATASYSKTLGASLGNDDTGLLKLINSAGTTISSVTALTSSLAINAITASYVTPYEGAWISYSVAWTTDGVTQPVIGNGSLTGAYKQIGKIVFVRVKLNCGSTTTFGTGAWQFGLPITASSPDGVQFACSMLDSSTTWYGGTVNGTYSGATFKTAIITPQPLTHTQAAVTATSPFAWGDTDSHQFNGSYESI